jgi:hypothetical protein
MRLFLAILALLSLTIVADAQGHGKGKKQTQDASTAEGSAKKKVGDDAYKNALKNIPDAKEKSDPWKTLR